MTEKNKAAKAFEWPAYSEGVIFWFLKAVGVVFVFVFWDLQQQILGLIGEGGVLPFQSLRKHLQQLGGLDTWLQRPMLFWFDASDETLILGCWLGLILSVLAIGGALQKLAFFGLWVLYFSYVQAGQIFFQHQWDWLILEVGLICIFMAPLKLLSIQPEKSSRLLIWLPRLLLFKLLFQFGLSKWLSPDEAWRDFTALQFHYMTQPLPNPLSWMVYNYSTQAHKMSGMALLFLELILPFFMFFGRFTRWVMFWGVVVLQIFIMATGNFGLLNIVTMILATTLWDDHMFRPVPEGQTIEKNNASDASTYQRKRMDNENMDEKATAFDREPLVLLSSKVTDDLEKSNTSLGFWAQQCQDIGRWRMSRHLLLIFVFVVIQVSVIFTMPVFAQQLQSTAFVKALMKLQSLQLFGSYGVSAHVAKERHEIIIEGSDDGKNWLMYDFRYKPDFLDESPIQVAPYMPRLDWQMAVEAQNFSNPASPWLISFLESLLLGKEDVSRLLSTNSPYINSPPKFVRATMYVYMFTSPKELGTHHQFWKRHFIAEIVSPLSLNR